MSQSTPLTLTEEQARERIVDYLYDELEGPVRAAFEQAMRDSEPLAREVDALARTLRLSRRGLRAAQEPAPSRVRDSVLAVAEQAARARAAGAETAAAPAALSGERVALGERGRGRTSEADARGGAGWRKSLFGWLRQPWALPALGAAAAIGLFVFAPDLRRVITRSEPLESRRAQEAPEPSDVAFVPPEVTEGAEVPAASAPAPAAPEPARYGEGKAVRRKPPARLARSRAAALPSKRKLELSDDDMLAGPGAGAVAAKPKGDVAGKFAPPPPGWGRDEKQASSNAAGARSQVYQGLGAAGAAKPAPAELAQAPAPVAEETARAPARAAPAKKVAVAADEAEALADAVAAPAAQARDKEGDGNTRAALLEKAERLLGEGRYGEAIKVYDELLRRFAGDKQASQWRKRKATAVQALERAAAKP